MVAIPFQIWKSADVTVNIKPLQVANAIIIQHLQWLIVILDLLVIGSAIVSKKEAIVCRVQNVNVLYRNVILACASNNLFFSQILRSIDSNSPPPFITGVPPM